MSLWYVPNGTCLLTMMQADSDVPSLDIPMPENTSPSPGNKVHEDKFHSFKYFP